MAVPNGLNPTFYSIDIKGGMLKNGAEATATAYDVSTTVGRFAAYQTSVTNTAATVTGLRGCDLRVNDNGGTLANIVAVQGVAYKTSGVSTGYELWGGNFIAYANGGKVENVYGAVGDVSVAAAASVGTAGTTIEYIAGVLGRSWVSNSATLSTLVDAAVVGVLLNDATARHKADGAFVAILGGDNGQSVTAGAAFKVMRHNSTASNKFDYGLDMYYSDGTFTNAFAVADVRLSGNLNVYSGIAVTRAAVRALVGDSAPQGSLFIAQSSVATTKPNMYIKVLNASADTDWERIVTAATD